MSNWFTELTGFSERSTDEVHQFLAVRDSQLTSLVNGASYQRGRLDGNHLVTQVYCSALLAV